MLYNYVYGFFYGFVHNHNYTYDAKSSKTTNRLSFTSYTYDAFRQCSAQAFGNVDCEYDYFSNVNNSTQYNYDTIAMASHAAIEQRHCYSNYIRYKFTDKEQDEATGFDYFGARYYDSGLSVWLSVDPLSDMYPGTSPFMYVLGNPIKFIDPNGMNHTKYEDSDGKPLGETQDGNTATVIISDDNKATFTAEFNSAKEVGAQNASYYKKRWGNYGKTVNNKSSVYNTEAIANASVQIVGGIVEVAIGVGTEFVSSGTSSAISIPLIVDGATRTGLNTNKLIDLIFNPEQSSNGASNLGGLIGQAIDIAVTGNSDYGPFQAAGAITNDVGMFLYGGGSMTPMFNAIKSPSSLNILGASTVAPNYIHSLFYDCKPLIKKQ